MKITLFTSNNNRHNYFVNLLAANDPSSTLNIYKHLLSRIDGAPVCIFLNTRQYWVSIGTEYGYVPIAFRWRGCAFISDATGPFDYPDVGLGEISAGEVHRVTLGILGVSTAHVMSVDEFIQRSNINRQ